MKRYNPTEIEQKWQEAWERDGTYTVDLQDHSKPKYYGMGMLPGITGAGIHIGHGRTYQFADIKVRAKRQQGYNAYNPIGWDSFGLPVENYAIKVGKTPRAAHDEAKENFIKQLKRLGFSYDWTKEISTADPEYYKWTQWIFIQLLKNGLAYQKESPQWWCETDQTVLANEQVEAGKCWRCGNPVVKKNLKQWFFKITEYADEMLEATDDLNWTDMVKTMQKNWIGKSQGAEIDFKVVESNEKITVFSTRPDTLFGATFLVLAPEHPLAKTLVNDETKEAVEAYIREAARKSEIERMNESREKTGVFTGSHAINPATNEKIPIWIADYVLAGYGTGAIMAVPAHDERDFAAAEAFRIPIVQVIAPTIVDNENPPREDKENTQRTTIQCLIKHPTEDTYLTLKWPQLNWHNLVMGGVEEGEELVEAALREIHEETGYKNVEYVRTMPLKVNAQFYAAHKDLNRDIINTVMEFKLKDLERDEPKLEEHEQFTAVWTKKEDLKEMGPISELPFILDWFAGSNLLHVGEGQMINSGKFTGMRSEAVREEIVDWLEKEGIGRSKTTYKMRDWLISRQRYWGAPIPVVHVKDYGTVVLEESQLPLILPEVEDFKPKGGATSVLATVEDWVHVWINLETTETVPFSSGKPEGDQWKEGYRETDTMDGYACSSWYFLRYIDPFNTEKAWDPEVEKYWGPVDFYNGGDHAVAHLLYSRFWMRFFYKQGWVSHPEPFKRMMYNAYIMAPDGRKMSKSLGNVIDPLEIMDSGYGADALRVYEMFIAPFDMDAPWDTRGVPGTFRFLSRVWNLVQEYLEAEATVLGEKTAEEVLKTAHYTIKKVTEDIEDEKFNTAVSSMMEAVNAYYKLKENADFGKGEQWQFALESLLAVLAPFAPHVTEELWYQLGHNKTIHVDTWPKWDDRHLTTSTMTIIVQVNGKLRAKLELPAGTGEEEVKAKALSEENVQKFVMGEPKKVVYVPGRLVNIVI